MNNETHVFIGGRYQLQELLGEGGMGAVYIAIDRLSGQRVALKRVLVDPMALQFNSRGSNDLFVALAQEFRIMATLRHPNINSVLDYGFHEGQPFFTMTLLDNAKSIFRASWRSEDDKSALLLQMLQALAYLHRRGVIHRDLKPANLLVVEGQLRVLDFGLSVMHDQAADQAVAGTLGYIAPELLLGSPPSELSDLYAVGVIGYELYTGQPFINSDDTQLLIEKTLTEAPELGNIANPSLAAVIGRLTAKQPVDRYQDAIEAMRGLASALGQALPRESTAIRESFLQTARFVGREAELASLSRATRSALEGRGSLWLIAGESGSGKTRLIDEVRIKALVQGMLVLRGENLAQGASPYQMWRAPLRALMLFTDLIDMQASILKALVPDIGDLIQQEVPDAPEVNPVFAQERLLTTIETLFQLQKRPLMIILDDLQWAGPESLDLLGRLARYVPNLPILVLASYREDERPELASVFESARLLKLARLSDENIAELSAAMLGDGGRQPDLVDLLQRETEGNPLFLVEVMRALAEQAGRLDRIAQMTLPTEVSAQGVTAIITRRLQRVPEQDKPLLRVAALYGRRLNLEVLGEFVPDSAHLHQFLVDCANSAVFEVHENTWQFSHDKLRDGVLEEIGAEDRPLLHRRIAEAMETKAPGDYAMLAYHWGMAGAFKQEAEYRALIGKLALESGAYQTAVENLERATAIEPPTEESLKQWANLKRMTADAYAGYGNLLMANELYQQSLQAYQRANYRWGVAAAENDLGYMALTVQDNDSAVRYFQSALGNAMPIRAWKVVLNSVIGLATILADRGDLERAAELAAMTAGHLSVDSQTADRAARLLNRIKIDLWPDLLAEAEARGRGLRLSDAVKDLVGS
jgi:tetratricopeptide (TPR) repeat protein